MSLEYTDEDDPKKSKVNNDDDSDFSESSDDQSLPPGQSKGIPRELKPLLLGTVGSDQVSDNDNVLVDSPDQRSKTATSTVQNVNGSPIPSFTAMDTESPRRVRMRSSYITKTDLESMLKTLRLDIRKDMKQELEQKIQTDVKKEVNLQMQAIMEDFIRPEVNTIITNCVTNSQATIEGLSGLYGRMEHEVKAQGVALNGLDETMKSLPEMNKSCVEMTPRDQMLTNLHLRLEEKEGIIKEQEEEIELIKRQDRVDVLLADGFYMERGKSLKENVDHKYQILF